MSNSTSSSLGVTTLLSILFIGLKITDNIDWSWWWVLSPIWISWSVSIIIIFIVLSLAWYQSKQY